MKHLRVEYLEQGEHINAWTLMRQLGVQYKKAIPQTMGDQVWFLDCEDIPGDLPACVSPLELSGIEYAHWTDYKNHDRSECPMCRGGR